MLHLGQSPLFLFFRVMLRNPTSVCAIAPSSRDLARAMTHDLTLKPNEGILELGPGTGALTKEIRRVIPDANSYLGIELEVRFIRLLKQQFPDLRFVHNTVARASEVHGQSGLGPTKAIISGLSVTALPKEVQEQFIENLDRLMTPGCIFRMFQYVHAYPLPPAVRFRQQMADLFSYYHRSPMVLKNLPPAFVLTWMR